MTRLRFSFFHARFVCVFFFLDCMLALLFEFLVRIRFGVRRAQVGGSAGF